MKRNRFLLCLLLPALLFAGCTTGPGSAPETSGSAGASSAPAESSEPKVPDPNAALVWDDRYADAAAGLAAPDAIYSLQAYQNGTATETPVAPASNQDVRYLFTGENGTRAVVPAEGYCMTLPGAPEADFSLGKLRSQYKTDSYCMTVTIETQNPYGRVNGHTTKDGYELYLREWLVEQIDDTEYLSKNRIMRTRKVEKEKQVGDFSVTTYCMKLNFGAKLDYAFYDVAIVRPSDTYDYFYLIVLKSKEEMNAQLDKAIESFRLIDKLGVPTNGITSYTLKEDPHWSEETRDYFRRTVARTDVGFGAFHEKNSDDYVNWLWGEEGLNTTPDLYMTYLHVGWYDTKADIAPVFERANHYAGGDGKNGKPVFNLTYQFTVTNNATGGVYTPMFDILRGSLDSYFRQLAAQIKAYGKPIIFRLNNEMNTDWTDYCGMMTLVDPDVFQQTWRHLYDLFIEEGVDNCIWVFNPISTSCPYSNWGDALCYMPGEDYVQMLGLTNYQMNNGTDGRAPTSFRAMYTETANKMLPYFSEYPWIIGEFACGSGGAGNYNWGTGAYDLTAVDRNVAFQTQWVQGMVECFEKNQEPAYDFCKRIKLAVWFSADDYADVNNDGKSESINRLRLDPVNAPTIAVLRDYLNRD